MKRLMKQGMLLVNLQMNWFGIAKQIFYLLAHQKKKSLFSVVLIRS